MHVCRPFILVVCALASIGATTMKAQAADVAAETPAPDAGQQLHAMLERYFEEWLQLNPLLATFIGDPRYNDRLPNSIGPEHRAQVRAMNERYLAEARAIDVVKLSPADRISHEIFVYERERMRAAERFPDHLLPVSQTGGLTTLMPALGSGTNAQPFATTRDYENWLQRLDGLVTWLDQVIVNMREGIAKGVVQPRPVMEKVLPQLEAMLVAKAEDSTFYAPMRKFPEAVSPF